MDVRYILAIKHLAARISLCIVNHTLSNYLNKVPGFQRRAIVLLVQTEGAANFADALIPKQVNRSAQSTTIFCL